MCVCVCMHSLYKYANTNFHFPKMNNMLSKFPFLSQRELTNFIFYKFWIVYLNVIIHCTPTCRDWVPYSKVFKFIHSVEYINIPFLWLSNMLLHGYMLYLYIYQLTFYLKTALNGITMNIHVHNPFNYLVYKCKNSYANNIHNNNKASTTTGQ